MKNGVMHKIGVRVVPFLVAWLLRLWFASCRIREHGREGREAAMGRGKAVIAIFWHYSLIYVFYHLKKDSAAVLVSASEDGEYIAQLARQLNFTTVRGSRNRRGLRALKELIGCLESGEHVGIVADGSQGPPLVVQSGAIMMASKTGSPIMPMAWSASRYHVVRSWDRTALPKLFSQIDYYYGPPLEVPGNLDSQGIEHYRLQLEERLLELYRTAWAQHGRSTH